MEKIVINKDISVFYVKAKKFPEGIQKAFDTLHVKIPGSQDRVFYGISRPEVGEICYKAAVEELYPGEAEVFHLELLQIRKGIYLSEIVKEYMKNISEISQTFQRLLGHPDLDPDGYCVEWYFNARDVNCMVRLL
jgi:hypothetical protein